MLCLSSHSSTSFLRVCQMYYPQHLHKILSTITPSSSVLQQFNNDHHDEQIGQSHRERFHCFSLDGRQVSILQCCRTHTELLQIHAYALRTGLFQLQIFLTRFLSLSIAKMRDGNMKHASSVFLQIVKPTTFMYNSMIRGYADSRAPEKAILFMQRMRRNGLRSDALALSFALKSCCRFLGSLEGRQIHGLIVKYGYEPDGLLMTILMDLYGKTGLEDDAYKVFDEMPRRDVVSWNVLISCFTHNRRTRDALGLFTKMRDLEDGSQLPDDVTCLLTLSACSSLGALDVGERVWMYAEKRGFGNALNIRNSLIDMYAKCGCLEKAFEVFDQMHERNVVTWSTMISAFAMHGQCRVALDAFRAMCRARIWPDEHTFTGVLSACSHSRFVDEGRYYFDLMKREFGIKPNIHHYGCMTDLLGRAGWMEDAYDMIVSMDTQPDPTIWRTLLGACRIYSNSSLGERVIAHLVDMKAQNAGDYVLLSNIYAAVGNWDGVVRLRRLMKDRAIMTMPGCSLVELDGEIHEFVVDDDSHPQTREIYAMLEEIKRQLRTAGYVPNVEAELHDLDIGTKESILSFHSEKLAMAFAILRTHPGSTVRVIKNLRICDDCHSFAKFLSVVYNREVIVRDRTPFHHFSQGLCTCGDYW